MMSHNIKQRSYFQSESIHAQMFCCHKIQFKLSVSDERDKAFIRGS